MVFVSFLELIFKIFIEGKLEALNILSWECVNCKNYQKKKTNRRYIYLYLISCLRKWAVSLRHLEEAEVRTFVQKQLWSGSLLSVNLSFILTGKLEIRILNGTLPFFGRKYLNKKHVMHRVRLKTEESFSQQNYLTYTSRKCNRHQESRPLSFLIPLWKR